jgi:hypothetical protein
VIRENLPLSDGSYNWDLSSLAYGDYQVYAHLYNGQPGNDALLPAPTLTGTDQLPGDLWIVAPGILHLEDAVPPAVPTGHGLVPVSNGFLSCWTHKTERDLAGYVVRYFSPDVYGNTQQHDLGAHAELSERTQDAVRTAGRLQPGRADLGANCRLRCQRQSLGLQRPGRMALLRTMFRMGQKGLAG